MLILARNVGESIVIAEDIIITVVEVRKGGKVRLGIVAPKNIEVNRLEVQLAKDKNYQLPLME